MIPAFVADYTLNNSTVTVQTQSFAIDSNPFKLPKISEPH